LRVVIKPDGSVEMVETEEGRQLAARLGTITQRRRATHIVPTDPVLRYCFIVIRGLVADDHGLAGWTRTWACQWDADLRPSGGPTVGPFDTRAEAIAYETKWLEENGWREHGAS
jgi:hypothetical protein